MAESTNPYKVEGREPNFWVNHEAQKQMEWRDGDIVVSVPAKSGTTWTMNICHQLRQGGDPDFEDIYKEVKWIEWAMPYQTTEEIVKEINDMTHSRRRVFKTHAYPGGFPYIEPKEGNKDVKYVVIFRNPEEACVSLHPFLNAHDPEITKLYDWKKPGLDSFEEYLEKFYFGPGGFIPEDVDPSTAETNCQRMFWNFVRDWWPYRNQKNVLFLHFNDMKKDHEGSIQKISDFLEYNYPPEQFAKILEYTSFPWMKEHQIKFELPNFFKEGPFLKSGAMVRKGLAGAAKSDGMNDELSVRIRAVGEKVLGENTAALEWYYTGGPLPE
uniref:Sulfotransferase domain-containing protein n=1 Tax=Paramoeba aestuarina TaxID=180227 RepID=A0A6U3BGI7_9EUKA|mmetsp:Transcript_34053/g.53270  ORF Transcript_34053/g.53270 Transcript_34053/m.53270 type:complete len:326 (+) Transcript_34053:114-1091(+)|eukprot:CAMPEP_0201521426 /NCGR_PEP_ID=MMETSP0161_2-20130828/14412_1 /ASSEMBLY_ACC=CAM_ASM_000251 /TAXON_ID=180227 /ORGANISM="Neoparamoeba aestuarina, Strain SoJaBio B1-5/56/2" /LENGTH=325 /DNA_ID=CAMNT_0047920063 /DNA_START=80 /DNA_END=1057 /DNA_ORIENTATION=-